MRRSPEIEALIRRYIDVRSRGDFALMRGLYSESDDFIAVGTREEDWIEGSTTFVEMVQADWDSVQTDHDDIRHLDAFENGETGWAVVEADRTTSGGQTFRYRLTVVYVLEAGVWRVLHSHFSIPEGAAISRGDLTATLSDLLDSVGDEVVEVGVDLARIGFQIIQVLFPRHGEHVVGGHPAVALLIVLEQRELTDPQKT